MGFFDKLFGSTPPTVTQPAISFGRYSDSYKSKEQYEAWRTALQLFEKQEYLASFRAFFTYLRDENTENVTFSEYRGDINFEVIQGSKKIVGIANRKKVKAEAKVAITEDLNIGFMRRLMEENFKMRYSCFALDQDNDITIVFETNILDASPYKLYYALKEVATKADKLDDLLIDEFDVLHHTDDSLIIPAAEAEKAVKHQFIIQEIWDVLDEIDNGKLSASQYPGGIAYLLLNLSYKLDYLTVPEGMLMETLERIHRLYFTKDTKTNLQKNALLQKEFVRLVQQPKADFLKGMYRVKTSFGITKPVTHDRVVSFIDGELHQMDWYSNNGHHKVAMAIPGYIVGYCLFNYAVPKPDKELFHLYYQVIYAEYFKNLGFQLPFVDLARQIFNKKAIKQAVKNITESNKETYPYMSPTIQKLNFDGPINFARSFLLMVRGLNLTKAE
ncbi:MAG: hypothetical protein AAF960_08550 [Bacteroidota bacterium]